MSATVHRETAKPAAACAEAGQLLSTNANVLGIGVGSEAHCVAQVVVSPERWQDSSRFPGSDLAAPSVA